VKEKVQNILSVRLYSCLSYLTCSFICGAIFSSMAC